MRVFVRRRCQNCGGYREMDANDIWPGLIWTLPLPETKCTLCQRTRFHIVLEFVEKEEEEKKK